MKTNKDYSVAVVQEVFLCAIADSFIPDPMDKQGSYLSMAALIGVSTMASKYRVKSCRKLPGTLVKAGAKSAVEPILKLGLYHPSLQAIWRWKSSRSMLDHRDLGILLLGAYHSYKQSID